MSDKKYKQLLDAAICLIDRDLWLNKVVQNFGPTLYECRYCGAYSQKPEDIEHVYVEDGYGGWDEFCEIANLMEKLDNTGSKND